MPVALYQSMNCTSNFQCNGEIWASGWYLVHYFSVASTDELWIGLNDIRTEGLFDWSDQSHVSFTSWEYGKPGLSTDGDDCVLIRGEVRPCAYLFIYMCLARQIMHGGSIIHYPWCIDLQEKVLQEILNCIFCAVSRVHVLQYWYFTYFSTILT